MLRKIIKNAFYNYLNNYLQGSESYAVTELGTRDKWNLLVEKIGQESNVLSAGVGMAITFEHELIRRTGCSITLFDPSPTGINTMAVPENQHPNINFLTIGLAGKDGFIAFGKPDRMEEGSWKVGNVDSHDTFECRSVSSYMKEHHWDTLHLLKIDIEGFEYEVLDDLLTNSLDVRQICVEFHTNRQIGIRQTRYDLIKFLLRMRRKDYRLAHLVKSDYTFVRVSRTT